MQNLRRDGGARMPQNFWNIGKRQILENLEPSMPSRQKSPLKQNIAKSTIDESVKGAYQKLVCQAFLRFLMVRLR